MGMLLDGELPPGERDALALHASDCAECASYRDELLQMRQHLQLARVRAPIALLDRVRASLEIEASTSRHGARAAALEQRFRFAGVAMWLRNSLHPHLGAVAAALFAVAIAVPGTWWVAQQNHTASLVAHEALAAHVRSLLQDSTVQVVSEDTHTVKPWFAGRVDYTPVVKDLAVEGFPLVGGRLDFVDGRRVATLVYRRRLHQISVFVWPAAGRAGAGSVQTTINGYNLVSWTRAGMTYWAVSDLNAGELRELESLL